jgi:hypothetical protein
VKNSKLQTFPFSLSGLAFGDKVFGMETFLVGEDFAARSTRCLCQPKSGVFDREAKKVVANRWHGRENCGYNQYCTINKTIILEKQAKC